MQYSKDNISKRLPSHLFESEAGGGGGTLKVSNLSQGEGSKNVNDPRYHHFVSLPPL